MDVGITQHVGERGGIVALEQQWGFYATEGESVGIVVGSFQIAYIYLYTLLFFSIYKQVSKLTTLEL